MDSGTIFIAKDTAFSVEKLQPWTTYEGCMAAPEYRSDPPPRPLLCRVLTSGNHPLEHRFRLPAYRLVDDSELRSPDFSELYIGFSPVAFDADGKTAFFYVDHSGCPLCGRGERILMKKRWGRWFVAQSYGVWVS